MNGERGVGGDVVFKQVKNAVHFLLFGDGLVFNMPETPNSKLQRSN